jgi:hypothetical protein
LKFSLLSDWKKEEERNERSKRKRIYKRREDRRKEGKEGKEERKKISKLSSTFLSQTTEKSASLQHDQPTNNAVVKITCEE